jgi:uncharacterized metal-binding protein
MPQHRLRHKNLSKRTIAIGTIVVLFTLVSTVTVFTAAYTTLQSINPAAALAAVTVAVIGIVWFKKTSH